jgi:hypothetical protein
MKNIKTPRTLAETQFTTGYAQSNPQYDLSDKVLGYVYAFAFGFVCGIVLIGG